MPERDVPSGASGTQIHGERGTALGRAANLRAHEQALARLVDQGETGAGVVAGDEGEVVPGRRLCGRAKLEARPRLPGRPELRAQEQSAAEEHDGGGRAVDP